MEYTIKPATIKDFDNTLNCEWTFSKDGEEYFKEHLTNENYCVFLAYCDNQIVGYLAGGLAKKGSKRIINNLAELGNMMVLEEFRTKGIGAKLYQAFLEWCKLKGVGRLRVVASAQNLRGINFYRKNGFTDYDLILEKNI